MHYVIQYDHYGFAVVCPSARDAEREIRSRTLAGYTHAKENQVTIHRSLSEAEGYALSLIRDDYASL